MVVPVHNEAEVLPLLSFGLGVLLALVAVAQAINGVVQYALGPYVVPGWTSLMVVVCLIGSAILISVGVPGEYVGRIFEESKGRPFYVVAESVNAKSHAPRESAMEPALMAQFQ